MEIAEKSRADLLLLQQHYRKHVIFSEKWPGFQIFILHKEMLHWLCKGTRSKFNIKYGK